MVAHIIGRRWNGDRPYQCSQDRTPRRSRGISERGKHRSRAGL